MSHYWGTASLFAASTSHRIPAATLLWFMNLESQQPKERGSIPSSLNVAIEAMNLAKEVSSITPAKAVFGTVSVLLTMIRVRLILLCD